MVPFVMIDTASLDYAVRRTGILLSIARRHGVDAQITWDTAQSLRWLIVERYHRERRHGCPTSMTTKQEKPK